MGPASQVTVHLATSNGTAIAGSDYTSTTTFNFGANQMALFVSCQPSRTLREGKETVT